MSYHASPSAEILQARIVAMETARQLVLKNDSHKHTYGSDLTEYAKILEQWLLRPDAESFR